MKCTNCGKQEATFYMRSNINGKITEVHLCPACAEKLGYTEKVAQEFHRPGFFADDFFTRPFGMWEPFSLLEPFFGEVGSRLLSEFPEPAEQRESAEAPAEKGLVDETEKQKLQTQRRRNALENRLKFAIEQEDFESAIKYRDELRELDGKKTA